MESEEIIRAYLLEPGDIFRMSGTHYKVMGVQDGKIYYKNWNINCQEVRCIAQTMGANSREKLILITNKTKQNEH